MNDLFVKICGITTTEQIDWAIEFGYNAIGIMRHEKSPRFCDEKKAESLLLYVIW
jgi:phosphoribosylanthranilate isomerase